MDVSRESCDDSLFEVLAISQHDKEHVSRIKASRELLRLWTSVLNAAEFCMHGLRFDSLVEVYLLSFTRYLVTANTMHLNFSLKGYKSTTFHVLPSCSLCYPQEIPGSKLSFRTDFSLVRIYVSALLLWSVYLSFYAQSQMFFPC